MKEIEFAQNEKKANVFWLCDNEKIVYNCSVYFGFIYNDNEVFCEIDFIDCSQIINKIEHPYFLNIDDLKEVKQMVIEPVESDPFTYGLQDTIDADFDFFNELKNDY